MDAKRFIQLVEEKKKKIMERKEAPLKWEQKLEAAAETKERKLKATKHKKRSGSDSDSDNDSDDESRKTGGCFSRRRLQY